MIDAKAQRTEPTHDVTALFAAPAWAAKLLTLAAVLGIMALASFVTGGVLTIMLDNGAPVAVGVIVALIIGLPAWIVQWLTRRSLGVMYAPTQQPQAAAPQQTVLVMGRWMNIGGKPTPVGTDRVTIDAPAEDVARMLAYIRETGNLSRGQVVPGARVSQGTWTKVMAALEKSGAVLNGGRAGYSPTDQLDAMLDDLETQL